ncbi:cysteine synthase [Spirochaetia bacterium]|nr:cysteine synthase [Spirochaetia bacterium]
MSYVRSILDLIGKTPLVKLAHTPGEKRADVAIKLEFFNAGGSVKDRIALNLIREAERDGILKPGSTIVEATSGNTGVGLALVAAALGYHFIAIMPDAVSRERKQLVRAYGGEVVETPAAGGIQANLEKLEELLAANSSYVALRQFENINNPAIHERTTGPEIAEDLGGAPDAFVAGVGTGGTITGAGKYLRALNPGILIVAVEPDKSPVLSGGKHSPHAIQGIGAGFVPPVLDTGIYDEIIRVTDEDAIATARRLAAEEGLLLGFSSGAAVRAALKVAERLGEGKTVVAIAPDNGERYLSTPLFV